jgi:ATP-grasp domain, R2K clade family 3
MRLLYPSSPMSPKVADDTYLEEYEAARSVGFDVSLFSFEDFERGDFKPRPALQPGDVVLYRGWMLSVPQFESLVRAFEAKSAEAFTSVAQYKASHHLPEWYPLLSRFTAETVILKEEADFAGELANRKWPGYFVKDYVKSLSTAGGSLVSQPEDIAGVVSLMKKYRGLVEGGVCIRRKEEYEPGSEQRYFVFRTHALAPGTDIPDIVRACASQVISPFFSVDVARRSDGVLRLIELGDGQVSDRKEWSATAFVHALYAAANMPMQTTWDLPPK